MGSGAPTTVRISAVVAASVMTTVRITPTRSATTPHTNFPVAPPANTSANARPTPPTPRPLAMRMNGMKVRKPVRVALSIMPIAHSAEKPRPSRMPQPLDVTCSARSRGSAAPAPSRLSIGTMASAAATPSTPYVAPAVRQPTTPASTPMAAATPALPRSPEKL